MQMLPKLARALMKPSFRQNLLDATTEAQVVDLVSAEVALDQPTSTASAATTSAATAATVQTSAGASAGGGSTRTATRTLHFVGVTSCPTGIAHTYMAAEALELAAKEAGHVMKVETQGLSLIHI